MPQRVCDTWFVPLGIIVSVVCAVYLFEQVEEEEGNVLIGKVSFISSGLLLMYIAFRHSRENKHLDAKIALYFEMFIILVVYTKVVQD